MRTASLVLILSLLTGCIIWPHRTSRSQEISGTILDERTHHPIHGARIFLTEHTNVAGHSGSDGRFRVKGTYNWHIGYAYAWHGDWDVPKPKYWFPDITTVHTNYVPRQEDWMRRREEIILLRKLGEPPVHRPSLLFNGSGVILKDMGAGQYLKGDIRITDPHRDDFEPKLSRIHIGFARRVYDPRITPVENVDQRYFYFGIAERQGSDWEFRSRYAGHPVKDSNRVYRLDFIP